MKRLLGFLVGVALGVALAMLVGWVVFPLDRQEITPASMRADYRAEYVRLVAASFGADGDLDVAEARLRALEGMSFTAPLVELTEQWIAEGRSVELVAPLVELARAFNVETSAMVSYVAGADG